MRKIICLMACIILIFNLVSCTTPKTRFTVRSPLSEISTVYDANGNIISQILYNELTQEYYLKDYYYECQNNCWTCIDQRTTIISDR